MLRLLPGQVIDGFTLVEPLHRGGMALLWRVTHSAHRQPLLMKVPLIAYGEGPGAIVGFEVDQMILPTLSGLHVPRFVAAGDLSELPYIVMEYMTGRSRPLPARADPSEGSPPSARESGRPPRPSLPARDPLPEAGNVMFRESGEAVLIDFGLSRHDRLPDLLAEEFRLPMGTGPYISPEQVPASATTRAAISSRSGYALLSRPARSLRRPGERARPAQAALPRTRPPRALRATSPLAAGVILRCLEVDPDRRYDTRRRSPSISRIQARCG